MVRRRRPNIIKSKNLLINILLIVTALLSILNSRPTFYNYKNSEKDSQAAIDYINILRNKYKKKSITFDRRAYKLAVARAKDMSKYKYYDHTNPHNGDCADKLKNEYGLTQNEYVAENINGYEQYSENLFTKIKLIEMTDAVDSWMNSRGHRYNLLYNKHISGAVGCHKDKCVFLGLNRQKFGSGCSTAAEGKQYWNTVPMQPGEIKLNDKF